MKLIPYSGLKNPALSLEVVDSYNTPLCVMAKEDVLRQRLPHRTVALLVCDRTGRALLTLSDQGWGFSSYGHVAAGMACESFAQELLLQDWGQEGARLASLGCLPPVEENDQTFLHLYTARLPRSVMNARAAVRDKHLLVDQDELQGLQTHFGDLLSPIMRAAIAGGHLFR